LDKKTGLIAAALAVGGLAAGDEASAQPPALYEKFEVLGVFDCPVEGDIRMIAGSERFLRCDYTPGGVPGRLKRYRGFVKEIVEGAGGAQSPFACWSVLRLEKDEAAAGTPTVIKGGYRPASAAVIAEYELKEGALVGGAEKAFALEPRCVESRVGENVADRILRIEITD